MTSQGVIPAMALLAASALAAFAQSDFPRLQAARNAHRAFSGGAGPHAQIQRLAFDSSSNGLLKGAYFLRQVLTATDQNSNISRAVSLLGTVTFDGLGGYTFAGQKADTSGNSGPYNAAGTYAVSSSGLVQMQNPIDSTDTEYGGIGAANEIVTSSTESNYDDILVAIPAGPASALQGTYNTGFIDFLLGSASNVRDGYYTLTPNGKGSFGSVTVNGAMANAGGSNTSQTASSVTYSFTGTTGTLAFPAVPNGLTELVTGSKTFAVSTDGNLILGGSSTGYDILVGVKNPSSVSNGVFSGVYFTGSLDDDTSGACGQPNCIGSFYGSINANGAGEGTQHMRDRGFDFLPYDYTTDVDYNFPSGALNNDGVFEWMLGAGGEGVVRVGTGNLYSLTVAFQAQTFSGSGVYLNPDGIVNAASFAPVTNPVAPGEYVTLFGSGLASDGHAPSLPLPATLGGTSLSVDGNNAPLLASASSELSGLIPNATSPYSYATFQATGSGSSNAVTVYTASTAPGIFTAQANGVGPADVFHANYTYVTPSNPAAAGEELFFYATGLGATNPAVADGAGAPSEQLATVNDPNLAVHIFDSSGKDAIAPIAFAGLAPGFAGVYQINVTVPAGIASGLAYLGIATTDGYTSEAKISMQ